jgi:Fur family zinc uptake transcriptional regulator
MSPSDPQSSRRSQVTGSPSRPSREIEAVVIDQLARANRPIGAYDIANGAWPRGRRLVPNQVYRTLDRLIARGAVQKVEILAAYVLRQEGADAFLICNQCARVQAMPAYTVIEGLRACAQTRGFEANRFIVEMRGICYACAASR